MLKGNQGHYFQLVISRVCIAINWLVGPFFFIAFDYKVHVSSDAFDYKVHVSSDAFDYKVHVSSDAFDYKVHVSSDAIEVIFHW